MAFPPAAQSSLILALSALLCGGCGEAATSGPGPQVPSAGSPGSAGVLGSAGSSGEAEAAGRMPSAVGGAGTIATVPLVYVGSTNGQISIFTLDAALGKLTLVKSVAAGNYPSFLAFDPTRSYLYAVNEADAKLASFRVDAKTGDLTFLNRVASGGAAPAFVSVDHSGKYAMVANYNGGSTRIFPIGADGSLGAASDDKSPGVNSHMIVTDPGNKFAFVMNKGSDTITQYAFDATKGTLTANAAPSVTTAAGAGPRHLAFHPNGKFAYVIDELDDTLSAYAYEASLGRLTFLHSKSTLPAGSDGSANSCAEVVVAPSGAFVYGSNRGHDSIARFSIDSATGGLTFIDTTPSGGRAPRSFTLSLDGRLMLVANESGNVTSFSVDTRSGALTKLASSDVPQKPQFVGIVNLPQK